MRQVDLTRDLRPWRAGDSPVLPDAVAAKLVADGEAENPRPWPEQAGAAPPQTHTRPVNRYLTRKRD